jgi:cytoskeletal protein RodZ
MSEKFRRKDLSRQMRVGQCLREAREKSGLSLRQIAEQTNISECYLRAIENGNLSRLPALIFQKNYVKEFARAVHLESEKIIRQYVEDEVAVSDKRTCLDFGIRKRAMRRYLSNLPFYVRVFGMVCVVGAALLYLGFQIKNIVEPPRLEVYTPMDGFITEHSAVLVQGETEPEIRLDINGKEISNGTDGRFKEIVDLKEGVNTIVVTAKKKHGKKTVLTSHVIFRPNYK